jgi:hypothetical protein
VENAPSACNPNGTASTDSIAVVNASTNTVANIVYSTLGSSPPIVPPIVLSHPVAMAQVQTPSGNKLYVANQGNDTVSSFNTVDMTPTTASGTVAGFSGTTPVWMVARGDGQQLYVLTAGSVLPPVDSQLWTIDTATDTVIGNVSLGTAGANYVLYDPNLNRLYVTNPNNQVSQQNQIACPPATLPQPYYYNSTAFIFSVAGNLPSPLTTPIVLAANPCPFPSCANGCATSVAALPDGTRAYVASYQLVSLQVPPPPSPPNPGCTDPNFITPASPTSVPACYMGASVTVLDALSMAVTSQISALAAPPGEIGVVPEVANCLPANANGLSTPSLVPVSPTPPSGPVSRFAARFRVSAVAAADSSRVYVSVCDAGAVAIVNTTDSNTNNPGSNLPADTLVLDLPTPFGTGTTSNAAPQQNPIFLLTGR